MSSRRLPRAAPFVLLVWLAGVVSPVLGAGHTLGFDDPACERPLWSGHPVTALEKDTRNLGDGHCGICHLQRAVRGALHSDVRTVHYDHRITVSKSARSSEVRFTAREVASSRAPPSILAGEAFLILNAS
jgi:hypothetical protein